MDTERLIVLVVKAVIEELRRQGMLDGLETRKEPHAGGLSSSAAAKSTRRVITAQTVIDAAKARHKMIEAPKNAIITPLARDTAKEQGIEIRCRT